MGTAHGVTQRPQTGEVRFLLPDEDVVNVAERDADEIRLVTAQLFLDRLWLREEVEIAAFRGRPAARRR